MDDWKKKIIERDGGAIPDWKRKIIEKDSGTNIFEDAGPDPRDISADAADAPWNVRMAVGALDKPEDRLAAIRKTYPNAKPYGDDNFIFTDENGKTRLYNQESWFPSLGDLASISPEIGETIGGAVGGTLGGIGGGALGSAVPVIGTGVGAVGGAVTGAGTGSVAGREGVQRGLNWLFGNDDTRTGSEQAIDAGKTFALGASGEGVGRAAGAGFRAGRDAYKKYLVGGVDDVAKAQARLADLNAIGAENPLPGMVNGNPRTSKMEHALSSLRSGEEISKRIDDAHQAMGGEFDRIIVETGTPRTKAELGELLKKQAELAKQAGFDRSKQLYGQVGEKVTSPAVFENTSSYLQKLKDQSSTMGNFERRATGSQLDSVMEDTTALLQDAQNGMTFDQLQKARTVVGQRMADTEDKVLKGHLGGLYGALTSDMEKTALASGEDAAQAWRKANNQYRRQVDPVSGFGKGSVADKLVNAPDTDKIWQFATETTNKGGNRIAQIRRTIEKSEGGKDAWADVVSSSIEQLGKSTDVEGVEQFNSTMFLNQWSKMSPEAKDAIFKGTKNQQYRQDLDRLARISNNMKNYSRGANHSNTATHQQMLNNINPLDKNNLLATAAGVMLTGDTTGMVAGAATGAAKAAGNKFFTGSRMALFKNPETVAWLADIPKAEMQKGGIQGHMKRLVEIRKRTSDQAVATAIAHYFRDLGYDESE